MSDNWEHRAANMRCRTCMHYVQKSGNVGRCRRHAPTMQGWPVMYDSDWCGDHKLNENATAPRKRRDKVGRPIKEKDNDQAWI